MKRYTLLFPLTLCLLAACAAHAQEPVADKPIRLHLSDNTDLVHFKQGDYILSLRKADLLEQYAGDERMAKCTALLTVGDTLDFKTVLTQFEQLDPPHYPVNQSLFEASFDRCLKEGRLRIHSSITGKDLALVRYGEHKTNASKNLRYLWVLEDPANDQPIYGIRGFRMIITPSF